MTDRATWLVVLGLLATSPALAQTTLDRFEDTHFLGVAAFDLVLDDSSNQALRSEIFVSAVSKSGWGGYLSVSLGSFLPEDRDSRHALGNLDLGVTYVRRLADVTIPIRLGLILPTAPTDEDFLVLVGAGVGRIADLATNYPGGLGVRASVSPRAQLGSFFVALDAGLDLVAPVVGDDPTLNLGLFTLTAKRKTTLYLRANGALGFSFAPVTLALELANTGAVVGPDGDWSDRFLHTFGASISARLGTLEPFFAFVTPLDDELRGEVYVLSFGLRARLD